MRTNWMRALAVMAFVALLAGMAWVSASPPKVQAPEAGHDAAQYINWYSNATGAKADTLTACKYFRFTGFRVKCYQIPAAAIETLKVSLWYEDDSTSPYFTMWYVTNVEDPADSSAFWETTIPITAEKASFGHNGPWTVEAYMDYWGGQDVGGDSVLIK